jgi:hypothetical protein
VDEQTSQDIPWGDDDLRAQLQLEARLRHWQVYRVREARWVRGVEVPAGSYYAVHWRVAEPPVVAADLDTLEHAVTAAEPRSIMAELLTPEEARHLEISEGRWHLPGPPP